MLHRRRHLLHGGGGLFERRSLLTRALRKILVCVGNLSRTGRDPFHRLADGSNGGGQVGECRIDTGLDLAQLAFVDPLHRLSQIAFCQGQECALSFRHAGFQCGLGFLLPRDIGGIHHDFVGIPVRILNRGIRGLQPEIRATLALQVIDTRVRLIPAELLPECRILIRVHTSGIAEHPMVLPHDLVETVPCAMQELLIGRHNRPAQIELDHCLQFHDRRDFPLILRISLPPRRHIGCKRHDLRNLAMSIQNWRKGGLQPKLLPPLAQPPMDAGVELAPIQFLPKGDIVSRCGKGRITKHPVMPPGNLIKPIAQRRQEVLIAREDRPVELELDHHLRLADGIRHPRDLRCLSCQRLDLLGRRSFQRTGHVIERLGELSNLFLGRHRGPER